MMRCAIVLVGALFAGCSPNFEKFAELCRQNGRVVVHDPAVWNAYVAKLRGEAERYSRQEPGQDFLVLFPVPDFDFTSDFSRGRAQVRRGTYQNNFYVGKNGQDAATIVNYVLSWTGPDSSQSADCV